MDDFVANGPNELISACLDHLLSTSAAKLHKGKDHICYAIQPSLCRVSTAFALKLGSRFKHAKFVRLHYAASEELSPERYIPVVSTSAIKLNDLSRTDKKEVFLANIVVCDQARDGRAASQDTRSSDAVVTLDALSFWLAILASRQYAFQGTRPFLLTIFGHIWSTRNGSVTGREDLLQALSLLDRQSTRLKISDEGQNFGEDKQLDEDKEVWCLQHPQTPMEAVLLRKSWLDCTLRHGRILAALNNKSALQVMCADVMQHILALRHSNSSPELQRHLAKVLCSLLLTWASYYQNQRYRQLRDIFSEETEEQQDIKKETAQCDVTACPCVLFHLLDLPGAGTLTPSLMDVQDHGIDEVTWVELSRAALIMHYIYWQQPDSESSVNRRECLDGLMRLASSCKDGERDRLLAQDIRVLSVATKNGVEALKEWSDLPLALPIDEDEEAEHAESLEIFNRLSLCVDASKTYIWKVHQEGIRRVALDSTDTDDDMVESHLLDLGLLRRFREGNLVSLMEY